MRFDFLEPHEDSLTMLERRPRRTPPMVNLPGAPLAPVTLVCYVSPAGQDQQFRMHGGIVVEWKTFPIGELCSLGAGSLAGLACDVPCALSKEQGT